jgi:predicted nucleic acid-binding protein
MSDKVFVDTNVIVYSRDATEPVKQKQADNWLQHLWSNQSGRISFQVLNEYYVTVTKKLKPGLSRSEARDDIRNLMVWKPAVIEQIVTQSAWSIQDHYGYSWWDCLILATALKQDCRYVLSEDMQHGQQIKGLEIVSPFKKAPEG